MNLLSVLDPNQLLAWRFNIVLGRAVVLCDLQADGCAARVAGVCVVRRALYRSLVIRDPMQKMLWDFSECFVPVQVPLLQAWSSRQADSEVAAAILDFVERQPPQALERLDDLGCLRSSCQLRSSCHSQLSLKLERSN